MISALISLVIYIFGIVFTIFFVVATHEYGHFATARLLGVKVLRFSVGFGKKLFRWVDKQGTEYVIALIPLGGYVKMLDENEGNVPASELHKAYNRQPFYKKFLIVLAGPFVNILCAFLLYWGTFVVGFTTIKPIIGEVQPQSIAALAGLKPMQEIVQIDQSTTRTWTGVIFRLLTHLGDQNNVNMTVKDINNAQQTTYALNTAQWKVDELTPDVLTSLGIVPYTPDVPLIVGKMIADSPASQSPLKLGDKIIRINNEAMKDWQQVLTYIGTHPDTEVTMTVERQHKQLSFPVKIGYQRTMTFQKIGYLGIGPDFKLPAFLLGKIQYGPVSALPHAFKEIIQISYFNLILFGKLLVGKLSLQSLGGPITIFSTAGSTINFGILPFIAFLAFLSISIGIINLLPIPGLDGGHLFIQFIEMMIKRPLPPKLLASLYYLGFLFILYILIQSMVNDLLRL